MKLIILIVVISFSLFTSAQYKQDLVKAPMNTFPFIYMKSQMNLKGPIKTYSDDYQTFQFDRDGFVVSRKPTVGEIYIYKYDDKHRLVSFGTASGKTKYTVTNDEQGRMIKKQGTDFMETYFYNDKGLYIRCKDEQDQDLYTFTYDKEGRLIQQDFWENGKWVSYVKLQYQQEKDFIRVNRSYVVVSSAKTTPGILYFKNGFNYESKMSDNLKFDSYGNRVNGLDLQGNDDGYSKHTYIYYE